MAKTPKLLIDIGQRQIKVLQVKTGKKGELGVMAAGQASLDVPQGADSETIYQRVGETLPLLLRQLGIKEKRAVISLPGRSAFTRRLKVPVVRGRQLQRIIRYEARQHIPFPLEQINMDYKTSRPDENIPELDVNLVAIRKEFSEGYTNALKKCKIRADVIEAAPLSIYNAYAASNKRDVEEVTAVISMGASSLDIVIEQNGTMQFMRSAPVAGDSLTSMLANNLGLSPEKAEEYKKKPASEYTDEDEVTAEQVSGILEQGFERIVTEIRKSFDFYVSQPESQPVTRIILCGGSSHMEGAKEFLEDHLGVPTEKFDAEDIEHLELPEEQKDFLRYEPALIGMAMRAAGRAVCALNFAPPSVKERLELERRAPMLSLMALLLVGMLAGSIYFLNTILETRREAVAKANMVVQPTDDLDPELRKVRSTQDKYMERFEKINRVAEKRGDLTRVFLETQQLVPQYIWLESVELTTSGMTIKGRALDDEKVFSYIQKLYLSPFFDNNAVVYKEADIVSDPLNPDQTQVEFTIEILNFNQPSEEEIKFINEFNDRTQDISTLVVSFDRENEDDPASPAKILIGVYRDDIDTDEEIISYINKIYTALEQSDDESVQEIELRTHTRNKEELQRIVVAREDAKNYKEGRLSPDDFVSEFSMLTPSPSPVPTPTPTPDEDGDGGDTSGGYGYGMGGYGMGGMGGGAPMGDGEEGAGGPPAGGGEDAGGGVPMGGDGMGDIGGLGG